METMTTAKQLPCGHHFHLACLRAWLQQSGSESFSCPLCRQPLLERTRIDWPNFGRVLAMLTIATAVFSVPLILSRGTIGTKPAIAKVLGLQNRSGPHAVEREKPLSPNQSELAIWAEAARAYCRSTKQLTTDAGLVLAIIGLLTWQRPNTAAASVSWPSAGSTP